MSAIILRRCVTPLVRPRCQSYLSITRPLISNPIQRRFVHTENEKKEPEKTQPEIKQTESAEKIAKPQSETKTKNKALLSWKSLAVMTVLGGVTLYVYDKVKQQRFKEINKVQSIGEVAVGGPFFLVDQYGRPTSDADFRGKYMLIYFGFSYCPDICPRELKKMSEVLEKLENNGMMDQVVPLYITIDPWRDTVEMMRIYSKDFHPKLIGLTGTPSHVTQVAKSYRVYMNQAGDDDEYLVDHSAILYLMGPNGKFAKFFSSTDTVDGVTKGIADLISPPGQDWFSVLKRSLGMA